MFSTILDAYMYNLNLSYTVRSAYYRFLLRNILDFFFHASNCLQVRKKDCDNPEYRKSFGIFQRWPSYHDGRKSSFPEYSGDGQVVTKEKMIKRKLDLS